MNFFRLHVGHSRIFGLDLLRFFAIIFVVIGHSMILVPKTATYTASGSETVEGLAQKFNTTAAKIYRLNSGTDIKKEAISEGDTIIVPKKHWVKRYSDAIILDGVAIFFVLSGFLIGGILIKLLEKSKPTIPLLLNFWNRRWLRTLPMYLLVLIFLIIATYLINPGKLPADLWKYFFFLQNFVVNPPHFFGESWSLSIEEWFYLLVPLLLFGGLHFFKTKPKTMFAIVIPLVIIIIVVYRYFLFKDFDPESNINTHYYQMQVMARLDSIMYGVLAAFVAFYYPPLWQKASHVGLVVLGIALLYTMKADLDIKFEIWIPALKSIAVMVMLPYLSNWKTLNWTPISKFVTFISLISYSMYLVNLSVVIQLIIKYSWRGEDMYDRHFPGTDWPLEYLVYWILTIGLSFLCYKLVEVPFMNLRKKAQ